MVCGGVGIALLTGLLTPQRWEVLGFVVALWLLMARYLLPVSVDVTPGALTFRWPLRRVRLTSQSLATARVLTSGGVQVVGLRRVGSARFGVRVHRYDDPVALRQALTELVRSAPGVGDEDRAAVLRALR